MTAGRSYLAWLFELAEAGAESLPVDRETFEAMLTDSGIQWTPFKPTLRMFDSARDGQQVAKVGTVPVTKIAD